MTKTIEGVVFAYKKEGNPNKKEKIFAICHLLENEKTITEVSKILFKAYNTIKNWWQAFKKDGIRGLETKKYPAVRQRSKTKTLLEFMGTKTKEEQYIVPENIARDLKTEFGVDYSLSGMRNASHQLHMQDYGTPAFKHAVCRRCFGVATRHEKVVFTPKKRQNRCLVQRHHHTPTRYRPQVRPVGTGGTARIWQLFLEPHKPIHKRSSLTIRQALLYCYKHTCHSCGNRFFTDMLKWRSKIAPFWIRHRGTSLPK